MIEEIQFILIVANEYKFKNKNFNFVTIFNIINKMKIKKFEIINTNFKRYLNFNLYHDIYIYKINKVNIIF